MNSPDRLSQGQSLAEIVANFQFPERNPERRDGMIATVLLKHQDVLVSAVRILNFHEILHDCGEENEFSRLQDPFRTFTRGVSAIIDRFQFDCNFLKSADSKSVQFDRKMCEELEKLLLFPNADLVTDDESIHACIDRIERQLDHFFEAHFSYNGSLERAILDAPQLAQSCRLLMDEIFVTYEPALRMHFACVKRALPPFMQCYARLCRIQQQKLPAAQQCFADVARELERVMKELPAATTETDPYKSSTAVEKFQMLQSVITEGNVPPNRQLEWGPMPAVIDHIIKTAEAERALLEGMTQQEDLACFDALAGFSRSSPAIEQQVAIHRRRLFEVIIQWFKGKQ